MLDKDILLRYKGRRVPSNGIISKFRISVHHVTKNDYVLKMSGDKETLMQLKQMIDKEIRK